MKIEWKYVVFGDMVLEINNQIWAEITNLDSGEYSWAIDVPKDQGFDPHHWYGKSNSLLNAQKDILNILKYKLTRISTL